MILPKFPKNCMKLRKFWAVGGGRRGAPLDPPLLYTIDIINLSFLSEELRQISGRNVTVKVKLMMMKLSLEFDTVERTIVGRAHLLQIL